LEISGSEITWLPERLLVEPVRQPSFLQREQLERLRLLVQQVRLLQRHGSMASQRPCGRGERSGGGMALVQRPCSRAWLLPCSRAWLHRPEPVLVREQLRRPEPEQRCSSFSLRDGSDRLQPGWRTQMLPAEPAVSC